MQDPLVSIIIPVFNRGHLISETLDSILVQTYKNWECIIVDDGSDDNIYEIIQNYIEKDSRFQFHQRPLNRTKGANACRNYGFEISKGEYINWFDSDDLMLPEKIHLQLAKLFENANCYMCVCQTLVFENSLENILGLRNENIFSADPLNDFITNRIKWLTQSPLIRRSFLLKNQLKFDEDLQQSQEWDFFVRILSLDIDYAFINEPLVLFRKHPDSISHGIFSLEKILSGYKAKKKAYTQSAKLSAVAIYVLKKSFIGTYRNLLVRRYYREANKIRKEILKIDYSFSFKVKINIAFVLYFLFNRGYFLLKMKSSAQS